MSSTTVATAPAVTLLASPPLPAALPPERHSSPPPAPARRLFEAAPTTLTTPKSRFLVTTFVVSVNVVQFVSNFFTYGGGLALSAALGREVGAGQANWMAASYALTQGAFVLITGRLGAIYGHHRLVIIGSLIFTIFSLANAFATTYISFIAMRALTGVGGGIFMPNAVATITTMIPPGKSRNLTLGFFAASPPIGGVIGALLAGVFIEMTQWKWAFVLMAGVSAILTASLVYLLPKETPVDKEGRIDYVGAFLGLGSLILFNVVWNQAPAVGWSTPYEIACLILSVVLFSSFLLWEKKYAVEPIMPLNIFRTPTFAALIFVVLLTYMGFGISLWYNISWQQVIRHTTVIQTGVNFIPFGIGAVASVALAAWLVPRVAAQWILGIGVATVILANILLATMPVQQTYWAQAFPSIIICSFCPDFVYVAAQLIASNSVGRRHQGVAGSLIGTLNLYGNSLGLGFAGTIESQVAKGHEIRDLVTGYKAALYFGAAVAVAALVLDFAFVRMPKDEREGWDDESEEIELTTAPVATAVERRS